MSSFSSRATNGHHPLTLFCLKIEMVGSSCSFRIISREHCLAVLAPRGNRFRSNSIAPGCGHSSYTPLKPLKVTFKPNPKSNLTQKVISREMVGIPDLQREARRDLIFGLIPGKHGLFLWDDNLLFSHEVIEGEDKAPVKVALTSQGVVVHICVLLVLLLPFQPSVLKTRVRPTFWGQGLMTWVNRFYEIFYQSCNSQVERLENFNCRLVIGFDWVKQAYTRPLTREVMITDQESSVAPQNQIRLDYIILPKKTKKSNLMLELHTIFNNHAYTKQYDH